MTNTREDDAATEGNGYKDSGREAAQDREERQRYHDEKSHPNHEGTMNHGLKMLSATRDVRVSIAFSTTAHSFGGAIN
jgi:hypothetical protein